MQIVTSQGFAPESGNPPARRMQGLLGPGMTLGVLPVNSRWLDRLSVPLTDPAAIQFRQDSNAAGAFSGLVANQSFAEWPVLLLTKAAFEIDPADAKSTTQGKDSDLGFVLDYPKYSADNQESESYTATRMEAFRIPAGSTDPYDLSIAGWNATSCLAELNPTHVAPAVAPFFANAIYNTPGNAAFGGGIVGFPVPYDSNDPDRVPLVVGGPSSYAGIRTVFGFSEYLWSNVWSRPLVLNSARLNSLDTWINLGRYPFFRRSVPAAWPKFVAAGISPDASKFDMTAVGAPAFDASSPVGLGSDPSSTGVGRFFWTAFSPFYNAASGGVISRTWLADATGNPPVALTGAAVGDATAALGFVPPQDTVVDKRGRTATGALTGQPLGGYRVTWYNPTRDVAGNPVPPDFWVVEFIANGQTTHYMLPGSFPAAGQSVSDLVLTDARLYLPSQRTAAQGPATDPATNAVLDRVGPGYCWFDVPPELRAATGSSAMLTVFAVKSILKNNPPAMGGARALNRPDWMDAVKTATATIKIAVQGGTDLGYAHKIPFNFPWDIVVVNGPGTPVAP